MLPRYLNFNYTLMDEDGELHPPKDARRNEIELTWEECHEIRCQVLTDALAFGTMETPLSAQWWRQLGDETQALMTEAMVHNVSTAPVPEEGSTR